MSVLDRFKGMSTAQASSSTNTPGPALGKGAYLINSVRMHENRKGGFRVEILATCLWGIAPGKDADGNEKGPNEKGDKISIAIFSGEYFHKNFKSFCLAASGKTPNEEQEICDLICPKEEYPNMGDDARLALMWDKVLPAMVCSLNMDGTPAEAGAFDGQSIVTIGTVEKRIHKKIAPKGKDDKSNWMHDANGQPITSVFTNSYFNESVSFKEADDNLDEKDKARFFGSAERFNEMLAQLG